MFHRQRVVLATVSVNSWHTQQHN